jgi:hypothetical protein
MSDDRGCCTACEGTGTVETGYPCEDCYATGHCHPDDEKGCDGYEPRPVGIQSVPTLVTPPKYGPPPGFSAEKWRGMNRAERREQLKAVAHTINRVASMPGNRETCQHGQLVGQCTECAKSTGK